MKNLKILILGVTFLLISCERKRDGEIIKGGELSVASQAIGADKSNSSSENFHPKFEDFAKYVLGVNLRVHDFKYVIVNYRYFDLLPIDGLLGITAFSDKNYPKKIEPQDYNHFLFFCYKYHSKNEALRGFDHFYTTSQLDLNDTLGIDQSYLQKSKLIRSVSKPGGLIVQVDKWIFHLVESCGNNPLGLNWTEYENLFIKYITEPNSEFITVLNADCGGFNYKNEVREIRK